MNKIIRSILTLQLANIGIDIILASLKFSSDCEFFNFFERVLEFLIISGKQLVCGSSPFTKVENKQKVGYSFALENGIFTSLWLVGYR